jgi:RNA polymerase sigma-70 factor, ECF subfamily
MEREILAARIEEVHAEGFAWALACCGWDREEAAEVLQMAVLAVLEGRARYGGRSAFKTWLFGVVRTTAAGRRRNRRLSSLLPSRWLSRAPAPPPALRPDDLTLRQERGARVRAALLRLSQRQREVLDLVFFHELTIEGAAEVMGVSLGTAREHYSRGKRALSSALSKEDLE